MISTTLYRTLIAYAFLMGITSFGLVWSIYVTHSWLVGISSLLLLVMLVFVLANHLNGTNRKIAFFLEAVENEDTALSFPEVDHAPVLSAVNRGLNKLNTLLQKSKMENRAQELYYHNIFNQVSTGILTKDDRGFIYLANTACKQLLQRKQLTHITQLAPANPKLHRVLSRIRPGEKHLVNYQVDEEAVPLLVQATGFKTPDRQLTIVTIQDIKNELDYKELDSWIKLISVLTHEIINTMSPITSLSESLSERFLAANTTSDSVTISRTAFEKTVEGLAVIKERGAGLIEFVDRYRRLTKLPKPNKQAIVLGDLINKIKILISRAPNFDRVSFRQEIIPGDLELFADEKLMIQALINILKNAIEALQDQPDGYIRIHASITCNGKVIIVITDNGPGIPPEIQDDIFIPFFTTKASGSGIGLTLSRQILRLHGGTLTVKTVPGKGTSLVMVV